MRLHHLTVGAAAALVAVTLAACTSETGEDSTTGSSVADRIGVPVEVVTPASGGGIRPVLEWKPVDGADNYRVAVFTTDGEPYWAWTGEGTSVRLGGLAEETSDGPQLSGKQHWQVVAFTGSKPVAHSGRKPIAP